MYVGCKKRDFYSAALPLLVVLATILGACSSASERSALCDRSQRLENEFVLVEQTLDDISTTTPQQLANTFVVTLATLNTLYEFGPSTLRGELALLLEVYESLAASIEATGWNGSISAKNPAVIESRTQLIRSDATEARQALRSFVSKSCQLKVGAEDEQFHATPTTLSDPDVVSDDVPEPSTGFDDDDTIASSYGYFVAEQNNLAITKQEALCIGRILLEEALLDLQKVDETYTQLVAATFIRCGVLGNNSGS